MLASGPDNLPAQLRFPATIWSNTVSLISEGRAREWRHCEGEDEGDQCTLFLFDSGFGRSVVLSDAARREGKQVVQADLRQFAPGSDLLTGACGDFAHLGNSAIRDCADSDHIHVGAANLCFHRGGRQTTAQPAVHLEERVIVGVRRDLDAVDVSYGQADVERLRRVIFGFDGNSPSQINWVHVRCSQSRPSARTVRRAFRVGFTRLFHNAIGRPHDGLE